MGKEWYWGGGRSSKNGGRTGDRDSDRDSSTTNPSGCMCSVFQIFDFHQFPFPNSNQHHHHHPPPSLTQDSFLPEDPPTKGNEAPRNSLELDQPPPLMSITVKPADECLHIPMGIHVKTNGGCLNDSCSSEISSSPGTKTPNLVARLMGLDVLPDECRSPTSTLTTPNNPSSRKSHRRPSFHSKTGNRNDYSGTRSLPETPRMSSARKSDVEHRLSLQINKENMSPSEELVLSRYSSFKRKDLRISTSTEEENRSPGHYTRQIVKQVKESVSRRVGLDNITNTVKSRDEILTQFKSKKIMATKLHDETSYSSPGKASCSPRFKFLNKDHNMISPPQKTKPKLQKVQVKDQYGRHHQLQQNRPKVAEERFVPQPKLKKPPQTSEIIRNKKEEPFVRTPTTAKIPDKKCKKSPLSNDTVPTLLPVKKDPIPPATKIPQKQALPNLAQESKRSSQLSSCSSHSYKQQETIHMHKHNATPPDPRGKNQDSSNGAVSAIAGLHQGIAAAEEEFEYITGILKRAGIDKDTPVSFTRWFSPSHPIDPSIFHYLEFQKFNSVSGGQFSHRCNRKLIFHLVDEILADILKPYINIKPWANSSTINLKGSDLIVVLCSKVRSFPCADCRVLEDIDALIDKDMSPLKEQCDLAFGEEGEGIVMEVQKDLLDTLVHETTVMLYGNWN